MVDGARWDSAYHAPVLAAEIVRLLAADAADPTPQPPPLGRVVLDGTLGGGGHSLALLEAGFDVVGVDRDPVAIAAATERLAYLVAAGRFRAVIANYAGFLAPKVALVSNIVLMIAVLLWRPAGLYTKGRH